MESKKILLQLLSSLDFNRVDIMSRAADILVEDLGYNYHQDISISNVIAIVGDSSDANAFVEYIKDSFKIIHLTYIKSFEGVLGNFTLHLIDEVYKASQIVFFSNFTIVKPQLGVLFANEFESMDSLIDEVMGLVGDFTFDKTILYFKDKCQYHNRNKTPYAYCHTCVDMCPTMAISKDDNKRELIFSDMDCVLCGKCVNVCPSGAMQKANISLEKFTKALKLYKDYVVLFVNEDEERFLELVENLNDKSIIPFVVPNIDMLNEVYLLSVLQESGRRCIIFGNSGGLVQESVKYINNLYQMLFGVQAVYCFDGKFSIVNDIFIKLEGFAYSVESSDFTRDIFSNRLKYFIKDNDYGIVENTPSILYTNLSIDTSKCTLCMSCVESCNTKALINSKDNFSLLLNPSLCTACGYCVDICPEKSIDMPLKGLELNLKFFTYEAQAKDEPFACVECGKVFASAKSITKVQNMMSKVFDSDEIKKKTLLCCSDCKVKVMFGGV